MNIKREPITRPQAVGKATMEAIRTNKEPDLTRARLKEFIQTIPITPKAMIKAVMMRKLYDHAAKYMVTPNAWWAGPIILAMPNEMPRNMVMPTMI